MDFSPVRQWFRELANLIFPRSCAGCGEWDTVLCPECAAAIGGVWAEVSARAAALRVWRPLDAPREGLLWPGDEVAPFAVWALGDYEGVRQAAVVRWKNTLDEALTRAITAQIRAQACAFASVLSEVGLASVELVPAPSSPRRKRDGVFVTGHIAQALAEGFRISGLEARVADVLETTARRGAANLKERHAKSRAVTVERTGLSGVPAILVDDVLTTGATLFGCAAALEGVGVKVAGAIVVAAAPDPRAPAVITRSGTKQQSASFPAL